MPPAGLRVGGTALVEVADVIIAVELCLLVR
jgi:hypothetical protein